MSTLGPGFFPFGPCINGEFPSIPDANDSWALVELYRWQYGVLPGDRNDKPEGRPLDIPEAMEKMAKALTAKDGEEMPTPMNVASVLMFAAKLVKQQKETYDRAIDAAIFAAKDALADPPTHQQDQLLDSILERLQDLKK